MTKICFVNRKFVNDCPQFHISESIADIEQRTNCSIVIHGMQAEVVWFCIKHELAEQRLAAFNLINQALKFTLNEVSFFFFYFINICNLDVDRIRNFRRGIFWLEC